MKSRSISQLYFLGMANGIHKQVEYMIFRNGKLVYCSAIDYFPCSNNFGFIKVSEC